MYTLCLLPLLVICLAENYYVDKSEVILRAKKTATTKQTATAKKTVIIKKTAIAKKTATIKKTATAKKTTIIKKAANSPLKKETPKATEKPKKLAKKKETKKQKPSTKKSETSTKKKETPTTKPKSSKKKPETSTKKKETPTTKPKSSKKNPKTSTKKKETPSTKPKSSKKKPEKTKKPETSTKKKETPTTKPKSSKKKPETKKPKSTTKTSMSSTKKPETTKKPKSTTKTSMSSTKKPETTKKPKTAQKLKTEVEGKPVVHNLDETFFCVLQNYGLNAETKVSEKEYPWIARVIHSKTEDFPHKCTASCIGARLFVTAARCITVLVVEYTRVKYANVRMPVLAFVVPSKPTKQMFDDIGIIVVEATSYKGHWPSISLTNMKRTDNDYQWFDQLQLEKAAFGTHKVVGFAMERVSESVYEEFKLSLLNVTVGMSLCYEILQENKLRSPDYWVPCYHACRVADYYAKKRKCRKYLGTLGAAVIDSRENPSLIGVVTWGTRFTDSRPPVGFAIPNSENFFEDLACAKNVLKDNGFTADMQSLCPPKKTL